MVQWKQKHLIPYFKCQQRYELRRVKLDIRLKDAADLSEEHRDLCVTPVRFRVKLMPSQKLFALEGRALGDFCFQLHSE